MRTDLEAPCTKMSTNGLNKCDLYDDALVGAFLNMLSCARLRDNLRA